MKFYSQFKYCDHRTRKTGIRTHETINKTKGLFYYTAKKTSDKLTKKVKPT